MAEKDADHETAIDQLRSMLKSIKILETKIHDLSLVDVPAVLVNGEQWINSWKLNHNTGYITEIKVGLYILYIYLH